MNPFDEYLTQSRRDFLTSGACGLGLAGLGVALTSDGVFASSPTEIVRNSPSAPGPKTPHFPAKAKSCIFIFMEGAPSQLDLFDPKPKLNELDGQKLPDSLVEKVRFAFIQKESATLMGSPRKFQQHGNCGMVFSDLLPHLATCADDLLMLRSLHTDQFNHHPGQLMMQCGRPIFGLPTMGSWLTYGLGNASQNLPGYVVLTSGRGSSGGSSLWSSGFLPSNHAGVLFRSEGEAVLNLSNPAGLPDELQRKGLDSLAKLNHERLSKVGDPEIASRINNYELAFRMQTAAPELINLSSEPAHIRTMYGLDREEPADLGGVGRGVYGNTHQSFARNCLLARRMVERGVRFINIIYSSWDHHSHIDKELPYNCSVVDQPIAALIKDLKARGLLDETMVVWGSEFGRTPLGENRPGFQVVTGRDHHPAAFTLLMAGGGFKSGLTYGATDEIGWNITENPVHIHDLHATMLHLFGLDHLKLTYRFQGRDFRLTDVAGNIVNDILA